MESNPLVMEKLGEPYAVVPGCAYGKKAQKNYVVWTNIKGWRIREKCEHCKRQTRHAQAHQPRDGQEHIQEEGYRGVQQGGGEKQSPTEDGGGMAQGREEMGMHMLWACQE